MQEEQIGPLGDQHPVTPKLETGWIVQVVGKLGAFVRFAVVVGVFQDQQTIVHLGGWLPVRIGWPGGNPETPLGIERHLHRINQLRKHRFVSK